MYEIGLPTITMTSKFVMTLAPISAGDSFTIRSLYSTGLPEEGGLSLEEVNDIVALWDSSDKEEILTRFRYAEDLTEGFGVVSISSQKIETVIYSEGGVEKEKTFEAIVTVEAVEDISAASILRL